MSGYRRFVAYVYEYRKGKKSNNCGFIKVEVKEDKCRMEMHLQCPGLTPRAECRIYGFVRNAGLLDGNLLGVCRTGEGRAECIVETDSADMGGSGISLGKMGGLILKTENGAFFGTEWDDQPIRPENFREVRKKQGNQVKQEKQGNQEKQERAEVIEKKGGPKPEKARREVETDPATTIEAKQEETEERPMPEKEGVEAEERPMPEKEGVEAGERPVPEKEGEATIERPEIEAETEDTGEEPAKERATAEQEVTEERAMAAAEQEEAREKPAEKPEIRSQSVNSREIKKPAMETDNPTVRTDNSAMQTDGRKNKTMTWGESTEPFRDGDMINCRKIQLKDICRFQQKDRALRQNRFLLYGYYNFGHLLVGQKRNGAYILGVPGGYDQQERFMANMFGFPYFKESDQIELPKGRGGYWYRFINSPNFR